MTRAQRPGTGTQRTHWLLVACLALAIATILAGLGDSPVSSAPAVGNCPRQAPGSRLGQADGLLPTAASVFDPATPAVANLDPDLLEALHRAATEAARDGVAFRVNSGWRSSEYQDQLFREAVVEHGSPKEAARWVATADTSSHVSGDAVDLGPSDALGWLSRHGSRYGLCQIYRNEPWHYELRPDAPSHGCPGMFADASHDPRMVP
jgi:hypothetical protein